jgi:hypothetical protein
MADISALKQQITGTVLVPGDEGYEESLKRWATNAERRAGIVVQVTSAEDASATVVLTISVLLMYVVEIREGESYSSHCSRWWPFSFWCFIY